MEKTFTKEVLLGDAGLPVDIEITVWFEEKNDSILVIDSEDQGGPENWPTWWPDKIKQLIEESFDKPVTFKNA